MRQNQGGLDPGTQPGISMKERHGGPPGTMPLRAQRRDLYEQLGAEPDASG